MLDYSLTRYTASLNICRYKTSPCSSSWSQNTGSNVRDKKKRRGIVCTKGYKMYQTKPRPRILLPFLFLVPLHVLLTAPPPCFLFCFCYVYVLFFSSSCGCGTEGQTFETEQKRMTKGTTSVQSVPVFLPFVVRTSQ